MASGVGDPRRLGAVLKDLRLRSGLSQREVARAIARSSAFVRSYESGALSLTVEDLKALASALGFNVRDLFDIYGL
jgi:transcriptional regulator with XRE-family HTH domain